MANQPTISVDTRAPTKKGGRLKEISGRLALSAGGSFGTSNMERFFRQKMTALNITLPSGKLAQYPIYPLTTIQCRVSLWYQPQAAVLSPVARLWQQVFKG